MARVEAWFPKFMMEHQARIPRMDWPELDTESGKVYWQAFEANLRHAGATEDLARDASVIMAGDPPKWLDEQSRALLAIVKRLREERSGHGVLGVTDDRESAYRASIGCLDCGPESPSGFATRYRHGQLEGRQQRTVSLFCLCPMGRWVRVRHASAGTVGNMLFHDLADHPFLWRGEVEWSDQPDNRNCYPPEQWDATANRPIEVFTPDSFKDWVKSEVAEMKHRIVGRVTEAEERFTDPSYGRTKPLYGVGTDRVPDSRLRQPGSLPDPEAFRVRDGETTAGPDGSPGEPSRPVHDDAESPY
jgi:hypothetical protein